MQGRGKLSFFYETSACRVFTGLKLFNAKQVFFKIHTLQGEIIYLWDFQALLIAWESLK